MSNTIRTYESCEEWEGSEEMSLTAYCGGEENGSSMQFTIGDKFCCLSSVQLKDLIKMIKYRLDCKKGYRATDDIKEELKVHFDGSTEVID